MILLLAAGVGMGGSATSAAATSILVCLVAHDRDFAYTARARVATFTAEKRK